MARRAVFVCCDGLGRDWIDADRTPVLDDLRRRSLWCTEHSAVFPSVTRASAASISTGCHPARHGLHGNRMGLFEEDRIVVRDVGAPDFRAHLRRATGRTLLVPSLAERAARDGGFVAFSNVSPGAAFFLDPDCFGHVHHRSGSHAPGGHPLDALPVTHDAAGDWEMTQRFCTEVLSDARPAVAFLWLTDPDHRLHGVPLGSPEHREALAGAGRCVLEVFRTVERLRTRGEDILLLVGSDHGQETIGAVIDIERWLAARGLGELVETGHVAVAGQGTAALLYATERGRGPLLGVLDAMTAEPWSDGVVVGAGLSGRGFAADGGVVAAVNMAGLDEPNTYGVPGKRWVVAEGGKPVPVGAGQHGGWGPDETRPFLMINDGAGTAGEIRRVTSLVDIAPTIARHVGLSRDGFDGTAI
ncbi:MAG: alkaline phosphatase family protein [Enhydrobacter sp.]|nr:MAG: alkaline phosphatase family protein [Enhydrobacter sp.]